MPYYRSSLCALLGLCMVVGQAIQPACADTPKWGAHLDFEGRWSKTRSLGDMGLFAPLWQNSTTLLFSDIRGKFDSQDGREGNFGIGIRRMLPTGWNVGAYGYYDARRTPLGNHFQQVTLGVEALSADFDIRGNLYLPVGTTSRQIGVDSVGLPQIDFSNGTIRIVTPVTNALVERAMSGFDGEIGWRAPVFDVESLTQLRLYAGGYHFSGGGVARDVSGPRGRLEFSVDDIAGWHGARLTLGAEWQHDDVRGTQGIGLARLRIPLQQHKPALRLSPQERRMTERVVRDVDIVSATARTQSKQDIVEDAINTWNNQKVTAVKQVSPANEAELQAALAALGAGSVVILNGTLNGIAATTIVGANQTLIGGGAKLALRGATSGIALNFIAPGAQGVMNGAVMNGGILDARSGSVIGGLSLSNAGLNRGYGLSAQLISGATFFENRIDTSGQLGIGVWIYDAHNIHVIGNAINTAALGADGMHLTSSHGARIEQNVVTTLIADGIMFNNSNNAVVLNNTLTGSGIGSGGVSLSNSNIDTLVRGNRISGHDFGLVFYGPSSAVLSSNTFDAINGVDISMRASGAVLPGSTGNVSNAPLPARCEVLFGSPSGTIFFTDGVNCVFP